MLMIWNKSRRQAKTSLVCVFSEVQRTDKEQIFHVNHHVCMHVAGSNRAEFFLEYTAFHFYMRDNEGRIVMN